MTTSALSHNADTLRRLMNVSINKRHASVISMNDIRDTAHFSAVASVMLTELRATAEVAVAQGAVLDPAGLIAWLDENQTQLMRSTATLENPT